MLSWYRLREQRPFTPFEIGDEPLPVPSPDKLPSEMTVYFGDAVASSGSVASALESLKSQILYDWEKSAEEAPPIGLEVVKKGKNSIRVRISAL